MHAPQKPYMLHAPAATPPKLVAHQCITHSEQPHTPAKPTAAANTQCNRVKYYPVLNQRFHHHPVYQMPMFLLALSVISQWQHMDQATPDMCPNA